MKSNRILGIDHGERRIGLAVSDETGLLARPLKVLEHRSADADAAEIARVAEAEHVSRIVVGLPLDGDGAEGHQARRVRRWAGALQPASSLPIDFWDESDSTIRAIALRPRKRKSGSYPASEDAEAAAVMLQDYLDARREA